MEKIVFITFDIDCINHQGSGEYWDEYSHIVPEICKYLKAKKIVATWFVRLDLNVKYQFGLTDYYFIKYEKLISAMKKCGHSVGWHPHYTDDPSKMIVNPARSVAKALYEFHEIKSLVSKHKLKIVRNGWGLMFNELLREYVRIGIKVDSSSIPRPMYEWTKTSTDWSNSPKHAYRPDSNDFCKINNEQKEIIEVPFSTIVIKTEYDKSDIERYINLAYHKEIFEKSVLNWYENNGLLLTITHPYEVSDYVNEKSGLLAFNFENFVKNLEFLIQSNSKDSTMRFLTLDYYLNFS